MKTRIISSLAIVLFAIAIIFFNSVFPLCLNISIALVSFFCVYEILKATNLLKQKVFAAVSLVVAFIVPFVHDIYSGTFFVYTVYSFVLFLSLIFDHKSISFKDIATMFSMTVMIPCALVTLIYTRNISEDYGIYYVIMAMLAAWTPDVGAYFSGTFFGKHKLCPDISPKKTVEGLIGGTIFSMVGILVLGIVFSKLFYGIDTQISYIALLALGFGSALTSVVGDLSFSLIKRSCGVKDFGQVIPGHGGLLDRFDSVIFTAPYAFFLIYNLPIILF